jgi:hypothetical protein
MPPAKNSPSRSSHPTTFKEPAALKWLSSSLDTAQQALVELREHTGRDVSQGARELHKDLRAFISSARRDSGKLAKALQRDFAHAQKRLSSSFGGDFAVAATRKPCYQVSSRPQLRHHELHTPRAGSVPLSAQLASTAATGRPRSTSTARVFSSKRHRNAQQKAGSEGAQRRWSTPRGLGASMPAAQRALTTPYGRVPLAGRTIRDYKHGIHAA